MGRVSVLLTHRGDELLCRRHTPGRTDVSDELGAADHEPCPTSTVYCPVHLTHAHSFVDTALEGFATRSGCRCTETGLGRDRVLADGL
ncbi:MAG: hypothetical protein J07HX64_02173 [halophilic archaeon J07HX64]|nr:MAG: hypothetical protein J07HX64_02173 [halophilic archaeon J07HX64]